MTCSGIFLTKFKVFGNVMKHCLSRLIYLFLTCANLEQG